MKKFSRIQRKILDDLLVKDKTNFNELWAKNGRSNLFAYHLKRLVNSGLVVKKGDEYKLSAEGKILAYQFSGDNRDVLTQSLIIVQLLIKKNGKVLVEKRLREPFKGFYCFIDGKVPFGCSFEDFACKLFFDRFGFEVGGWVVKGFEKIVTYQLGELTHDVLVFTLESENVPELELRNNMQWVSVENYNSENVIPCPWIGRVVGDDFFFINAVRRVDGDRISCELLS